MADLPAWVPEPVRERVDAGLARPSCPRFDPRRLRTLAQLILATLDPTDLNPPKIPVS